MAKRLVMDLDGTITHDDPAAHYSEKAPNIEVVRSVREYKARGFDIIIYSSRNMHTFDNSLGKVNAVTLPLIVEWLKRHDVPFDEIHVGKPWCGTDGFYVDDRAIRPSEFTTLSADDIATLIKPNPSARNA